MGDRLIVWLGDYLSALFGNSYFFGAEKNRRDNSVITNFLSMVRDYIPSTQGKTNTVEALKYEKKESELSTTFLERFKNIYQTHEDQEDLCTLLVMFIKTEREKLEEIRVWNIPSGTYEVLLGIFEQGIEGLKYFYNKTKDPEFCANDCRPFVKKMLGAQLDTKLSVNKLSSEIMHTALIHSLLKEYIIALIDSCCAKARTEGKILGVSIYQQGQGELIPSIFSQGLKKLFNLRVREISQHDGYRSIQCILLEAQLMIAMQIKEGGSKIKTLMYGLDTTFRKIEETQNNLLHVPTQDKSLELQYIVLKAQVRIAIEIKGAIDKMIQRLDGMSSQVNEQFHRKYTANKVKESVGNASICSLDIFKLTGEDDCDYDDDEENVQIQPRTPEPIQASDVEVKQKIETINQKNPQGEHEVRSEKKGLEESLIVWLGRYVGALIRQEHIDPFSEYVMGDSLKKKFINVATDYFPNVLDNLPSEWVESSNFAEQREVRSSTDFVEIFQKICASNEEEGKLFITLTDFANQEKTKITEKRAKKISEKKGEEISPGIYETLLEAGILGLDALRKFYEHPDVFFGIHAELVKKVFKIPFVTETDPHNFSPELMLNKLTHFLIKEYIIALMDIFRVRARSKGILLASNLYGTGQQEIIQSIFLESLVELFSAWSKATSEEDQYCSIQCVLLNIQIKIVIKVEELGDKINVLMRTLETMCEEIEAKLQNSLKALDVSIAIQQKILKAKLEILLQKEGDKLTLMSIFREMHEEMNEKMVPMKQAIEILDDRVDKSTRSASIARTLTPDVEYPKTAEEREMEAALEQDFGELLDALNHSTFPSSEEENKMTYGAVGAAALYAATSLLPLSSHAARPFDTQQTQAAPSPVEPKPKPTRRFSASK